jgi:hypothetical protein
MDIEKLQEFFLVHVSQPWDIRTHRNFDIDIS